MQKSRQFSILIKYKDSEISSFTLFNFFANPKHHSVERGFQKLIVEFFSSLCTHKFINFHFGKGRFKNFSMIAFFLLLRPKIPIFHHIFFPRGIPLPFRPALAVGPIFFAKLQPKKTHSTFSAISWEIFLKLVDCSAEVECKMWEFQNFQWIRKIYFHIGYQN